MKNLLCDVLPRLSCIVVHTEPLLAIEGALWCDIIVEENGGFRLAAPLICR